MKKKSIIIPEPKKITNNFLKNHYPLPKEMINKEFIKLFKNDKAFVILLKIASWCFKEGVKEGRKLKK